MSPQPNFPDGIDDILPDLQEAWQTLQQAVLRLPRSDMQYRLSVHTTAGMEAHRSHDIPTMQMAIDWIVTIVQRDTPSNEVYDAAHTVRELVDELVSQVKADSC